MRARFVTTFRGVSGRARSMCAAAGWGMVMGAAMGCAPMSPGEEPRGGGVEGSAVSVATLWGSEPLNRVVVVRDARVVSGPTVDEGIVFVQDAEHGHGLAVRRRGHVPDWPPPVGTVVRLSGLFVGPRATPTLWIEGASSVTVLDTPRQAPIRFVDPPLPRAWALVRFDGVRVLGDPDPSGRTAVSVGREIDGRFGVALPGFDAEGDLSGVVMADGAIAPRFAADWTGDAGQETVPARSVRDLLLGDGRVGETIDLTGVQATPWSIGGRWVVLQDPASGVGLFVDTEAWSARRDTVPGDRLTWRVQVGVVGGQAQLRAWEEPRVVGQAVVTEGPSVRHGALWTERIEGIGPSDAAGERAVGEAFVLDDRFLALDDLPDPAWIRSVIDSSRAQPRRVVLEAWPAEEGDTDLP